MSVLEALSRPRLVLWLRVLVYGVLILLSFVISGGVVLMKGSFHHQYCPLYGDYRTFSSESNCNFPIAISVIFQMLFLLFRSATLVLLVGERLAPEFFLFSEVMEMTYTVLECFGFFFTLVGASLLTVGTMQTCELNYPRCNSRTDNYGHFYTASQAAQAGSWISVILWLAIFMVGVISWFRSGKSWCLGGRETGGTGNTGATHTGATRSGTTQQPAQPTMVTTLHGLGNTMM